LWKKSLVCGENCQICQIWGWKPPVLGNAAPQFLRVFHQHYCVLHKIVCLLTYLKMKIWAPVLFPVGNLQLSVGILTKIWSVCGFVNGSFLARLLVLPKTSPLFSQFRSSSFVWNCGTDTVCPVSLFGFRPLARRFQRRFRFQSLGRKSPSINPGMGFRAVM